VDLLEALLLVACFAVIEILVSSFQIPHFEVTIESLIHVLIRNDPRKENRKFYPLLYSEIPFDFPSTSCLQQGTSRDKFKLPIYQTSRQGSVQYFNFSKFKTK